MNRSFLINPSPSFYKDNQDLLSSTESVCQEALSTCVSLALKNLQPANLPLLSCNVSALKRTELCSSRWQCSFYIRSSALLHSCSLIVMWACHSAICFSEHPWTLNSWGFHGLEVSSFLGAEQSRVSICIADFICQVLFLPWWKTSRMLFPWVFPLLWLKQITDERGANFHSSAHLLNVPSPPRVLWFSQRHRNEQDKVWHVLKCL